MLPGWLGLPGAELNISAWDIARNVLIFLGIPLAAGYLTRRFGERTKGRAWYEQRLLPRIGPAALYGLLFTIVILFALQGEAITSQPLDVARIALPLLAYFAVMRAGSYLLGKAIGLGYERTTTLAFTAAGNNFEFAIAVAIGTFGVTSGQALAGVVGPLIEVPVLVALVYVSLWARRRYFTPAGSRHDVMNCLDCGAEGVVGVCADCGAAVCRDHAVVRPVRLTRTMGRCCVEGSMDASNLSSFRGQIAQASSANAAATRIAGGVSTASS